MMSRRTGIKFRLDLLKIWISRPEKGFDVCESARSNWKRKPTFGIKLNRLVLFNERYFSIFEQFK